ncbi:hypothetical protein HW450_00200 [Corynebacterium hindlerae]|uniref:Uncharacterized protein n=1 Tax=Corynebacterium hindlerae TaxID=699041 RepID=A0A7G5FIX2_9CORY|nr:hypothetical protein [Corynebacterium hindlerae]QMV86563.1 hypothetical protein HW450_00200 [Corynebacterium hindlerae]QTH60883.1 hypothetical protein J5O04_08620 [Corynebacterium hindlerae]
MAVGAPIPRDPRQPKITPAQLDDAVAEVLSEPAATVQEEAEQLARAHDIVHEALQ